MATAIARYLILNRGVLELGLPDGWEVQPKPDEAGALVVKDPTNSIHLDANCWPTGVPEGLTLEALLMSVVGSGDLALVCGPETGRRGDLLYTWVEDVFEMADEERDGEIRQAHCRWYLCTNGRVTGQVRFFYWEDDASWALPTWRAIIETVQLGTGAPLASPFDHWTMKSPD